MFRIRKTAVYAKWLDGLRDVHARSRIPARVERLAAGNPGDVRPVGEDVPELRIDLGPGYRVYNKRRGQEVVILLAGGDKRTQGGDFWLVSGRMADEIILAPEAVEDLWEMAARHRANVTDAIDRHLRREPGKVSRSRNVVSIQCSTKPCRRTDAVTAGRSVG